MSPKLISSLAGRSAPCDMLTQASTVNARKEESEEFGLGEVDPVILTLLSYCCYTVATLVSQCCSSRKLCSLLDNAILGAL